MIKRRSYRHDGTWQYVAALRMCQTNGRRLGRATRLDGVWVYYLLDGKQYRFRKGRSVGPEPMNAGLCWPCEHTTHTTTI
jgi:hypothetical protein